jgi:hypothetical protein
MIEHKTGGLRAVLLVAAVSALVLPTAANASAAVQNVNTTLLNSIRASAATTPPPRASRAIAMVGVAMFDAVNAGSHMGHQGYSYAGPAVNGVSRDALAIAAGYTMMGHLFPTLTVSLTADMNTQLNGLSLSSGQRAASLALGSGIATSFFNARAGDGSAGAQVPYTPGSNPGDFQPPNMSAPVLPLWGSVNTFAAANSSQFGNGAPLALGSAEWIAEYNQVKALGCATCGTPEQQLIARFWADGGGTFTPPGHWLNISNSLMTGLTTLEAARLSAYVGMSVADAGITAWQDKYTYNTWRPVTAINNCTMATCGVDGEPGWTPLLATPNFPSYVSGHSSFSGGAAGALAAFFKNDAVNFCTGSDPASAVPGETRCFNSFSGAAAEAGISRIYGGIHYEDDNGKAIGNAQNLGQFVVETQLAKVGAVPEPTSWAMLIAGFGLVGAVARRRRAAIAA